jgi:hypothetical protein
VFHFVFPLIKMMFYSRTLESRQKGSSSQDDVAGRAMAFFPFERFENKLDTADPSRSYPIWNFQVGCRLWPDF